MTYKNQKPKPPPGGTVPILIFMASEYSVWLFTLTCSLPDLGPKHFGSADKEGRHFRQSPAGVGQTTRWVRSMTVLSHPRLTYSASLCLWRVTKKCLNRQTNF